MASAATTTPLRASDYQRLPMRVVNSVLGFANRLGIARAELDVDTLLREAQDATGLEDFGDERFLVPLGVLIHSLNNEAQLNPIGWYLAKVNITRLLQQRLRAEALFRQHPEILEREIPDPVVVVGLARSGTTRQPRLLAADPGFAHLKSWESVYPVPTDESFAARDAGQPDPRIKALDQALKAVLYMSPQVAAVHPLGTLEVEEEIGLIQHGFSTQLFEIINSVPSFAQWLMTHDQKQAYEYFVRLLKLVAWFRGDSQNTPWVLKSPQHMQDLDALLHVFPGAKLVCPHRDPVKVVGSCCSMAWNSMVRDNPAVTPEWVGQEWLRKTQRMLHKNLADRAALASDKQQYDLLYADISADWESAMQGVYDFLETPFTAQAKHGMQQWLDSNAQHKHGAHKYHLSQFGLEQQQVDDTLMFYRERFNIPYETANPHTAKSA